MATDVSESNIAGKIEKSKTYGLKKTGASADGNGFLLASIGPVS